MKNKIKKTKAKLYNHIHKVKKRHVEKFVHTWAHTNHTLIHLGELIIVGAIGAFTMLHASYDNSYQHLYRESSVEISKAFTEATKQEKPKPNQSKIISIWKETRTHIENTFFPGYCTWGAALASPEFFPFTSEATQQRTRGGNAVDRCSGANATGYKIGSNPSLGALIVYKGTSSNGYFGHVGKVMYHNSKYESMIIRDMNRVSKYTWTDRREDTKNKNIKCYIYPKKSDNNLPDNSNNQNTDQNNDKFNTGNNATDNTPNNSNNTTENTGNNQKVPPTSEESHNSAPSETTNSNQEQENNNQEEESNNQAQENSNQEQENNNFYNQTVLNKDEFIIEKNTNFSDITNHFISQNDIKIKIIKNQKINIGDVIKIQITITNRETKKNYLGILPFILNSITQNSSLKTSLKTIQFIHEKENIITFTAKEKGKSNIVLTIDDQKIITKNIEID